MKLPLRFGKYELIEHVATGGMAEVFRARSFGVEGFQREICIKRILPGLSRDPRFISMFVKEARICSGLRHPNIVQIYELGRIGDDHFMAMEYVHGRDLGRMLRRMRRGRIPMPVSVAVQVVVEALRGLGFAHALTDAGGAEVGVVHRDISPHNILVGFEGEAKVFDFGVAQIGRDDPAAGGGGKRAYMSPEQVGGQGVDARSDLFAMGIVLYELLTGRKPKAVSEGSLGVDISGLQQLRPELPVGVTRCVARLCSLERDGRPASASVAADQLRAAMYEAGVPLDRQEVRRFLLSLYPELVARAAAGAVDIDGLASDIADLGRGEDTGRPTASALTPRLAGQGTPGGRRPVVALVAELVGMTQASTTLESERIFRRHMRFLRRAWKVVADHDGSVEGWQDDTLTVFFGLPRAHGHDLERALACADSLVKMARSLPESVGRVELCIGVHQGEISVGPRLRRRHRYVAHGDTIKLARHLSMLADPGQVLVSPDVARLARRRFDFSPGPTLRRRTGDVAQTARALVGRRLGDELDNGRWLARGDELTVISRALTLLATGRGTRLAVFGRPGTGKSRLLREVMVLSRKRGARVAAIRGLPYGAGSSLRVMLDLVRAMLGLGDGRIPPSELEDRLARLGLDPEAVRALRLLVSGGSKRERSRTGEGRKRHSEGAVVSLMREISRSGPFIVAIEDVQYLDAAEQQILARICEQLDDCRILWWLSAREKLPEVLPAPEHSIGLDRMPVGQMRLLAAQMLGARSIGSALGRVLSRNAEGNPLYVETILGTLQQRGQVVMQGGVADLRDATTMESRASGLDALIAERVDALEPELRSLLQLAVTIGPRFHLRLLGEAAGLSDPAPLVDRLVERRIVVPVAQGEDGDFAVSSTLVGQVVQKSLLGAQRRACHRAVAGALNRLYSEDLTPHRVQLAGHCAGAGDWIEAARHGVQAGQWFSRQQLLNQAARVYEDALGHVQEARDAGIDGASCAHAEAVVRADLGAILARRGMEEEAERHLRVGLDLSAELMLTELEASTHLELGRLHQVRGDNALAVAHLEAARDTALAGIDSESVSTEGGWRLPLAVRALESLAVLHDEAGAVGKASQFLQAAQVLAADDPLLRGQVWLALARPALRLGDQERGHTLLSRALECAERCGDRILQGKVHNNFGILHHAAGEYELAIERFETARGIREGLGYRRGAAINLHNIGDTYLRLGDHGRGWSAFSESRTIAERIGWRRGMVLNDLFLGFLELRREGWTGPRVEPMLERHRQLVDRAFELGDREAAVTGQLLYARMLRRTGNLQAAAREVLAALDAADQLEAKVLAHDLRLEQAAVAAASPVSLFGSDSGARMEVAR